MTTPVPTATLANPSSSSWPTPEQELLIAAALLDGAAARDAWEAWKARVDLAVLDLGTIRLLPLVYENLRTHVESDALLEMSKGLYRRTWYMNHLLLRDVGPALAALREAGVPTLLLKGPALVLGWYKDYGLRPMGDCDVAVPVDLAGAAMTVLERLGWTIDRRRRLPQRENLTAFTHAAPFRNAAGTSIDLHWYVVPGCRQRGVDDEFWGAAVAAELNGVPTRILAPSDQLLHVLLHGAGWDPSVPSFRWIPDAATILRAPGVAIDWMRVAAEARKRRRTLVVVETLRRLRAFVGDRVPAEVVARISETAISDGERRTYERIVRRRGDPPTDAERRAFGSIVTLWRRYEGVLRAQYYDHELARVGRTRKIAGFARYMLDDLGGTRLASLPLHLARKIVRKPSVLVR